MLSQIYTITELFGCQFSTIYGEPLLDRFTLQRLKLISTMSGDHTAKSKFTSTLDYLFSVTTASIGKHFPKFAQPLCQAHDVCWCEECLVWYRSTGFTKFRNSCEHFDAPCLEAAVSEHHINQIQFILKYVEQALGFTAKRCL